MGFILVNWVMMNWKYNKNIKFDRDSIIMGIIVSLYEWLYSVECYYDRNCIYCINNSIVNNGIKYWIRRCVCKRNLLLIII